MEHYAFLGDNKSFEAQASKKKGLKLWRKQVLKYGTWKHPSNKEIEFSVTPEVAKQVAENFESGIPNESPIVITHTDNPNFKVGLVRRFIPTESGLDAVFSVADDGLNENIINPDKAPGVSCWLDLNYQDKQSGEPVGAVVKHIALVNHPYIEGMEGFKAVLSGMPKADEEFLPLVLSEERNLKEGTSMEITKEDALKTLKEKHGLDVDILLSGVEELKTLNARIDGGEIVYSKDAVMVLSEDIRMRVREQLKLGEKDVLELSKVVTDLLDAQKNLGEQIQAERAKLMVAEQKLSEFAAEKSLEVLMSEGRVLPTEKETLVKLALRDKIAFDELLEARKKQTPLIKLSGETGHSHGDDINEVETEKVLKRNVEAAQKEGRIKT